MWKVKTVTMPAKRKESFLKIRKLHFLITAAAGKAESGKNMKMRERRHFNGKYFVSAKKDRGSSCLKL